MNYYKKLTLLGLLFVFVFAQNSFAEDSWLLSAPPEVFKKESDFGVKKRDIIKSVSVTKGPNMLVSGSTYSKGYNPLVFELAENANELWRFAPVMAGKQYLNHVTQLKSGEVIAVGRTSKGEGGDDVLVIKLDSVGNLMWQHTYGGTKDDVAFKAFETELGGIFIVGTTKSKGKGKRDLWVLKLAIDGTLEWEKVYGGSGNEYFGDATIDQHNNILIAGRTGSDFDGGKKALLTKIDMNGELLSQKTYVGANVVSVGSVIQDSSNITYLGSTRNPRFAEGQRYYPRLTAISAEGSEIFTKELKLDDSKEIRGSVDVMSMTPDGGMLVLVTGIKDSHIRTSILKLNSGFERVWHNYYQPKNSSIQSVLALTSPELGKVTIYGERLKGYGAKIELEAYPNREAKKRGDALKRQQQAQQRRENDEDSWGAALGSALRVTTGALLQSGAIEDADTLAYVGIANAAANSVSAESQGKSTAQIQRETAQVTSNVNSQIKENSDLRVAKTNANTARIEAENNRLKLELENAKMKAELQRLRSAGGSQGQALQSQSNNDNNASLDQNTNSGADIRETESNTVIGQNNEEVYGVAFSRGRNGCILDEVKYPAGTWGFKASVIGEDWVWQVNGIDSDPNNNYAQIEGAWTRADGATRLCYFKIINDSASKKPKWETTRGFSGNSPIISGNAYIGSSKSDAYNIFKDSVTGDRYKLFTSLKSACAVVTQRRFEYCER